MKARIAQALLQLAAPQRGSEIRKLVRELARVSGVRRVAPSTTIPRLLSISFDPKVTQAQTLVHYVKRRWDGARLV